MLCFFPTSDRRLDDRQLAAGVQIDAYRWVTVDEEASLAILGMDKYEY
jgi:hypothetical protein